MLTEEVIHVVPGIVQHVRPVEIVKLTRIHPERKQGALAEFHEPVDQSKRFEEGPILVGRARKYE